MRDVIIIIASSLKFVHWYHHVTVLLFCAYGTTSPMNAARFQEAFGQIDVSHRLAQVNVPTIVFHSEGDQRIPVEQGRALAAGIRDAEFVPLDSRNHILVDGEPALQACTAKMSRFLEENGI